MIGLKIELWTRFLSVHLKVSDQTNYTHLLNNESKVHMIITYASAKPGLKQVFKIPILGSEREREYEYEWTGTRIKSVTSWITLVRYQEKHEIQKSITEPNLKRKKVRTGNRLFSWQLYLSGALAYFIYSMTHIIFQSELSVILNKFFRRLCKIPSFKILGLGF